MSAAQTSHSAAASGANADLLRARVLLDALKATHPLLDGVTVTIGETPGDAQAVSYYREGMIVVSPDHVASIDKIISHEIWHIIDWRDNGRIDWGEQLPPSNAASYITRVHPFE